MDEQFVHIPYVSGGRSFERNPAYDVPSENRPSQVVVPNGNAPMGVVGNGFRGVNGWAYKESSSGVLESCT